MLITVAYAEYLNGGNFDEVLSIIEQAIDTEFDPLLKMKRYFQYHIISMFEKDYDNAIEILNSEKTTLINIYIYLSSSHPYSHNSN